MELKIYNQSGELKLTASTSSSSTWNRELMTENAVSASFTHPVYVPLDVNDYILLEGVKFSIKKEYKPKQKNRQTYSYSVKFYAPIHDAGQVMYLNLTDGQYEPQFSLDGSPREHLQKWVENMNRVYGEERWHIGDVIDAPNETIEYSNTYCWDALGKIAEAFGTEWWEDGFYINLCRCERGERVSLGYLQGLTSLTQTENTDDVKFFTRLIPLGSTKNIDRNRYGFSRLQLPDRAKYIDRNTQYGLYEHVEADAFAGIFPHYTGTVAEVRTEEKTGDDGKSFTIYYFKDTGMQFNPCENEIGGLVKHASFQSGDLAGRDFEANYHSDTKEWEIINTYPDEETQIPGGNLIPRTGDTYIPWNFRMPVEYETQAEKDYKAAVDDFLAKYSEDIAKYGGDTDYTYIIRNAVPLLPGQSVRLLSEEYFPGTGYRDTRMTKVVRKLDNLSMATIECTNQVGKGWRKQVDDSLNSLQYVVGETLDRAGLDVLKTWDDKQPGNYNVFSAKRTLKEIRQLSLSRLEDDEAAGHLTLNGGVTVKSGLTARQLKSAISGALDEPGDNNPEIMSLSLAEEGDGNPDILSTALSEVALDGGSGGGTLGELDNVDPSFDTLRPGKYGIEVKSDGIIRPVPATSLGVGSRLTLTAKSGLSTIALAGDSVVLEYEFSSFDTSDGSPTGAGTAYYNVNGVRVATLPVEQGVVAWDCTKHLTPGDNTITVSVTDAYSVNRMLTFTVQIVALSISSTFDEFQPYTGDIPFRYTPVGAITKNVIFKLDGGVIATVPTTANNRQMTQTVPAQTHGGHVLEVYIEAVVGDRTVRSNVLRYGLACYVPGNSTPVIASSFNESAAGQYDTLTVPFFVYNPAASTASVVLSANGAVVSERIVNRTRQVWNYRADTAGRLTLGIAAGSVSKSFTLEITASEIDVSAETEHLQLYLTAAGRSNNEAHPEQWANGGIAAVLTGFNFVTNGWTADEKGVVSLKVSGDARVAIPMKIFGDDFKTTGKTIEFELSTTDVVDYNAIVVSCMNGGRGIEITAQSASLRSEQSFINTRFKEDERVRVSFVIEDRTGSRLIYTYIDGIASGVVQYPTDDNFMQPKPADIVIGSNDCTVCIHNIRVYESALNSFQMLDNCIADMDDMQEKIAMYTRNQIFDTYGDVSYPKVMEHIPGLTIIGDLPTFKGDKKTVVLVYEDRRDPLRSWRAENVQIDVQGTSSQYYPRKNFKVKCKGGFTMAVTGETVKKIAIREGGIPVSTFCFKADFAESSGTHNTGMAKIVDRVLRAMNYLVPPQKLDARVRTTVDGYPFTIFHRATEAAPLEFVGKYNFNNDKSTQETFGFVGAMECWEIRNNTSDRVLFLRSDYTDRDAEGTPDWLNDFEARYPDDDDLNAGYEAGKVPVNLKRLTDWIVSTRGDAGKFKAEAAGYFDLDFLLSYYSITELFAMVDQRAKNMFLTTYDGTHWVPIFYDNDTVCGINNEGAVAFGYNVEYHDTEGSGQVWNGEASVLWNNVEAAFLPEITAMYQLMRSSGAISYDMCIGVLNGEQSDKWCEAIYNADGKFKYIDPLLNDGNGSYLYALQGSRSQHRKWWLYNRFRYIDSKYVAGDFKNDYVTMRLYTPNVWHGVKPNADFTLTPGGDVYVAVKYGSYIISRRGHKGVPVVIKAPEIAFNDTETIVYGAAYIGSLGDLSGMYPGTVDISKATKLTELIVGSGAVGYQNSNLTVLAIGNNTLFRRLNVMNCNKLTQPIDVSGCENIEEIYAQGTSITSVKLPSAGRLSQLYLPDTITSLTIRNQTLTQDGFELAGISNLSTVYIENTNGIDSATLINRCLAGSAPTLERVRLIGVDWRLNSLDTLVKLSKLKGLDVNGMNTDKSVITGKCHVLLATSVKLAQVQAAFPELAITYMQLKPETVTTFVFGSSQRKAITNSVFECNFDFEKVSETTYKVTAQDNETISFTFKCDNHEEYSNSYLVAGTRTQNYSVTYIPLRTIRVKVYNQNVYLQGATVIANGKRYTSDANGYATLTRGGEAVSGTVEAFGYAGNAFSFGVITNDVTNTVEVYAAVEVKFVVKDNYSALVQGATIICGNEQGVTNLYGECILMIGKGTYEYKVTHPKFFEQVDSVTVGTSASTVNVSLIFNAESVKPLENGNIQMYIRGTEVSITINSTSAKHVIDWGDGTPPNTTIITGNVKYSHTYLEEGDYQVEISHCEDIIACNADANCLIAYWSIGNSKVSNLSFGYFEKLSYVGAVFKNDSKRESFRNCFIRCYQLTSIPSGLFDDCVMAKSFYSCFSQCYLLTSIPAGLFDYCTGVTDFSSCFSLCYKLTSIPAGLFDYCTMVTVFSHCFCDTDITLIPVGLFNNCTLVKNFSSCFYNCDKLTSIPSGLFDKCTLVNNFNACFRECSSLVSIPVGLFDNCTKVTIFNQCFYSCTSLTFIPAGLFDNCTLVTDFSSCFYICYNITSIPTGLFDSCTMVTYFNFCFADCSKLTSIPEGLFDNCTKVTNFNNCFRGCRKVISLLPQLWIQYYGKTVTKENCFSGCTSASNWLKVPTSWGGTAPEYVPPVEVSGVMMADYRALEMRIRNLEQQQNMDKN